MSVFTQENVDASVAYRDQIAAGPRLGFLGALEASYDAQVRASSQFGVEVAMREAEQENRRRIKAAGGEAPRSLNDTEDSEYIPYAIGGSGFTAGVDSGRYMDFARAAADKDTLRMTAVAGDREDRLKELQAKFPNAGIQTYGEIFENVRTRAQEAEKLANTSTKSIPGYVGGFIGDAAGALDLRVNPLNFATIPAGSIGRTVLGRIASQGVAQGAIEALNQVTGVQENRRILGVESGLKNALTNVAGAAIGGAVLQGAGEAVGAAVGKWFRNAPHDPAPPLPEPRPVVTEASALRTIEVPPETSARIRAVTGELLQGSADPMARTRVGSARATADLDHTYAMLERWDTPSAWALPPTTATRPFNQVDPTAGVKLPAVTQDLSIDARARSIDPETFAIYDKMAAEINDYRARVADIDTIREQSRLAAAADTTQQQIDTLRAQQARMKEGSTRFNKLEQQIADLEANRPAAPEGVAPDALATEAELRANLMKVDEGMRDLAPVISRAYARARSEWTADEALRAQVDEMLAKGSDILPVGARDIGPPPDELFRPLTIADKVPELSRTDIVRTGQETAADVVIKAQAVDAKLAETTLAARQAEITRVLNDPNAEISFDGINATLRGSDMLKLEGPNGDMRTLTIKQAFEELNEDLTVLKAISSCKLSRTS